ncbi:MAG: ComF family protein, partial [Anaerolineae bacterium]|nr:ComF family protein [Anaerolineae bacterium]
MSPITSGWSAHLRHHCVIPLLDLVFPAACIGCGRVGTLLCPACAATITPVPPLRPTAADGLAPLLELRALGLFADTLREAIHALKFSSLSSLAQPLSRLMADKVREAAWPPSRIVPVPLHANRQRQRGFNQAGLLAAGLADALGWPFDDTLLCRQQQTRSQVGLTRSERQRNVRDAFAVTGTASVQAEAILLVDDVYTTGATMLE